MFVIAKTIEIFIGYFAKTPICHGIGVIISALGQLGTSKDRSLYFVHKLLV